MSHLQIVILIYQRVILTINSMSSLTIIITISINHHQPYNNHHQPYTRWCPRSIAKLVNITPIATVFVGDISIVFMGL